LLLVIIAVSMTAALIATFATKPVPEERLTSFVERARPPGWWGPIAGAAPRQAMAWIAAAWVAGNTGVFAITFGIGHALLGRLVQGTLLIAAGLGAIGATLWAGGKARSETAP